MGWRIIPMIDNPVYSGDIVRGSDLQLVVDAVNANEVFTDNMTIIGSKSEAGMSISVIDQYGGGGGGDSVASTSVSGAEVKSGGNGLYNGDLLAEDGEVSEAGVDFIATPSTVYNLPVTNHTVAYKVSTSTLGSN